MRLEIQCEIKRTTTFPVNHQQQLAGAAYSLLRDSDPEYARFLHDDGYKADGGARRYKLFTFSGLRAPRSRRRVEGRTLWLSPGCVQWIVSSPCESFLTHFATGLLSRGGLQVGDTLLPIVQAQTNSTPDFHSGIGQFTCLTPLVASQGSVAQSKYYLRPSDSAAFSEALRANLIHKYTALYGHAPSEDSRALSVAFDLDYLARNPHGGTKKITFKNIDVIGALVPFTVTGTPELIRLGYEAGFGELNACGFGMVETAEKGMKE